MAGGRESSSSTCGPWTTRWHSGAGGSACVAHETDIRVTSVHGEVVASRDGRTDGLKPGVGGLSQTCVDLLSNLQPDDFGMTVSPNLRRIFF